MAMWNEMRILEEMGRVFRLEIDTLNNVWKALDDNSTRAVEMLLNCQGKIVVTGMGKSGYIAQKIASTMVSTGTQAVFLHPGDGMHGDVGIIQGQDVVIAISKSGESDELLSILLYAKNLGVPLIAITAQPSSTLAGRADLVLHTPVDQEACPLNLAPTSSSTAALVLGDALAMTLMKLRGFNPDEFARYHPGGQLGKRLLLRVRDIMRAGEDNPLVHVNDTVQEMLSQITGKRSGAVSVVDGDSRLLGLITDYDIRKVLEKGNDIFSLPITEIMNRSATSIYSDEMAVKAMDLMENRGRPFLLLPVLDRQSEKVVGLIHLHDMVSKGL